MTGERLLIPQDSEYFQAVGLAMVAFARLEWEVVYCCERLEAGYIHTLVKQSSTGQIKGKTAGRIAEEFMEIADRIDDDVMRLKVRAVAENFRRLKNERNSLLHAKPMTSSDGSQRLSLNHEEWSLIKVNDFADRLVVASMPINSLIHGQLNEGHEYKLRSG